MFNNLILSFYTLNTRTTHKPQTVHLRSERVKLSARETKREVMIQAELP